MFKLLDVSFGRYFSFLACHICEFQPMESKSNKAIHQTCLYLSLHDIKHLPGESIQMLSCFGSAFWWKKGVSYATFATIKNKRLNKPLGVANKKSFLYLSTSLTVTSGMNF